MWFASPGWPGIHTLSIGSHSSVGPQFFSPRPMQVCGKFSRKKLVKCSLESTTHACTPRATASFLMWSSAPKKLLRCSSGAAIRAEDIIGAWEAQYARPQVGGQTLATAQVSGNFPGSPAQIRYKFTLRNDKIAALAIGA